MTETTISKNTDTITVATTPTKNQQVVDLLSRNDGATLEEMSIVANWLPHSTRAFLTGLKKKGYTIASDKTGGIRRYRTMSSPAKCDSE